MALLPSIMSLFGGKAPTADPATAASQTAAAVANPTVPSPGTPASTGSVPAIPAAATGNASPLQNFETLWQTDPNANNNPPATIVPNLNLEPGKVMEHARKVDFAASIQPEQLQKALSGDIQAFKSILNDAVAVGFANATLTNSEIMKQSLKSAGDSLTGQILPTAFRNQAVDEALKASNPVFSDPSVAPLLGNLKNQLTAKYPTAPASEITKLATQYLAEMSQKIVTANGGQITQPQATDSRGFAAQKQENWESFFGV